MIELGDLTILQLLEEHNRLNPQEPLKSWPDGQRKQLIDKVLVLREKAKRATPTRTIKSAAYAMLLEVAHQDHNGRNVGLSYDVILSRLKEEFPDSDTTDKCLRWYQVQLNGDGAKVPWRPRRTPKRRKVSAEDLKEVLG